ncbi:MAG: zeta toxin family protein [Deltaproteobacteria bacterium]|nr:zeta toxin family protein [Deltaproteobacteria bacterium]
MVTEINRHLYIIAGPNGSGKTTFVRRFLPYYADCINLVNADLIAAGLSPFSPDIAAIKAGRIMLEQIQEHINAGHDFAIETTLAGRSYVRLLKDLKKKGYKIHLFYLWLHKPDLALKRIAARVRAGGHDVPAEVVRRRYARSVYNFFHLYRQLLDSWMLFDNSADLPRLIADEESGHLTVIDDKLFSAIERSSK